MKKLQVFVSSTYTDLLEERQAAVEAILKSGHIPAGMELFSAGNKSQLETIYNWIDECDVYCLILGGRYGSIDPETGKSYTELEYDYARSKEKPYFSILIKQEAFESRVKSRGISIIENDNPQLLKDFRAKVLESISSFFEDCKDIKLTIHESMSSFSRDSSLPGWVSGREIENMHLLRKENDLLKRENDQLKLEINSQERTPTKSRTTKVSVAFEEQKLENLDKVLKSTEITVPKEVYNPPLEEDEITNLKDVMVRASNTLVRGVTSTSSGEFHSFLYNRVFPKLQIHGLSDNERPPGVIYRRSYLNKEGLKYLSWLETRKILTEQKSELQSDKVS